MILRVRAGFLCSRLVSSLPTTRPMQAGSRATSPHFSKGFTLIELVLVILILGIIAGVAVPAIRGVMDETVLDESVQEIVGALRSVSEIALQNHGIPVLASRPSQESSTLLT